MPFPRTECLCMYNSYLALLLYAKLDNLLMEILKHYWNSHELRPQTMKWFFARSEQVSDSSFGMKMLFHIGKTSHLTSKLSFQMRQSDCHCCFHLMVVCAHFLHLCIPCLHFPVTGFHVS